MEPIILWMFLAVVQMKGLAGGAQATQAACEEARQEALAHLQVIAITPCAPVTLERVIPDSEKG